MAEPSRVGLRRELNTPTTPLDMLFVICLPVTGTCRKELQSVASLGHDCGWSVVIGLCNLTPQNSPNCCVSWFSMSIMFAMLIMIRVFCRLEKTSSLASTCGMQHIAELPLPQVAPKPNGLTTLVGLARLLEDNKTTPALQLFHTRLQGLLAKRTYGANGLDYTWLYLTCAFIIRWRVQMSSCAQGGRLLCGPPCSSYFTAQ